jgi:hypothetical protein
VQEKLVVPACDMVAATAEVLKREVSLSAERGGFKSEFGVLLSPLINI